MHASAASTNYMSRLISGRTLLAIFSALANERTSVAAPLNHIETEKLNGKSRCSTQAVSRQTFNRRCTRINRSTQIHECSGFGLRLPTNGHAPCTSEMDFRHFLSIFLLHEWRMEATNTLLDISLLPDAAVYWMEIRPLHSIVSLGRLIVEYEIPASCAVWMRCSWSLPQPHPEHMNAIWNTTNAEHPLARHRILARRACMQWTVCFTFICRWVPFATIAIQTRHFTKRKQIRDSGVISFFVFDSLRSLRSFWESK